jgi:hypothetical protein
MFDTNFFASPLTLLYGALTGLVFGFLLHRGGVTRFGVIVKQFLLRDFTVLKIMGTAIVVGGIGVYGMLHLGILEGLKVKSSHLVVNAAGGVIFGAGMAILGYCPGTGIAAIGAGSRDAIAGVFGMLFGAAVFAEAYPWIKTTLMPLGDLGKETLVTTTGVSEWWYLAALAIAALLGFLALERWENRRQVVTAA